MKLARVYVQQANSWGLVGVKKKHCEISRTQEQLKPVKENLLVCTGLNLTGSLSVFVPLAYMRVLPDSLINGKCVFYIKL